MHAIVLFMPIFFIALLGYLSGRFVLFSSENIMPFAHFVFFIAMPAKLFLEFATMPVSKVINIPYILAFALIVLLQGMCIFVYTRYRLGKTLSEAMISVMGSSQVNTAYFAIPLFILVFGNPGPVLPILIFQVVIMTPLVLLMIEYDLHQHLFYNVFSFTKKMILIFLKNPIIISSFLGLLSSFFSIPLSGTIINLFDLIGNIAAPLALFTLGLSMYFDFKFPPHAQFKELLIVIFTKLIIAPILAFFIGKYLLQLDAFWLTSLVLVSGMPSAKNTFIFAARYQLNMKNASAIVTISTLLSFVTLNVLFFLFHYSL